MSLEALNGKVLERYQVLCVDVSTSKGYRGVFMLVDAGNAWRSLVLVRAALRLIIVSLKIPPTWGLAVLRQPVGQMRNCNSESWNAFPPAFSHLGASLAPYIA